jgi:hypothetical protein
MSERDLQHAYALFYAEPSQGLGICGCGNPETAFSLVRDLLNLAPFFENPEAVRKRIGEPGACHLVLSMLDNAGLIDHGGGIGGSWLLTKGEYFKRVLSEVTWEQIEEEGFPHDGGECTDACWVLSNVRPPA